MKANGPIIKSTATASTCGKMAASTTANGLTTICMGQAFIFMRMGFDMMDSTIWIRRKDMVCIIGPMGVSMKAGGIKGNSMAWDHTQIGRKDPLSMDCGSTESA